MLLILIYILLLSDVNGAQAEVKPCRAKTFGFDSVACSCDDDYCDSFNPELPSCGQHLHVQSNKDGLRYSYYYAKHGPNFVNIQQQCMNILHNRTAILQLDRSKKEQVIVGFGTSFTDATGYNLNKLSTKLQDEIVNACFGKEGNRFNMARTTIGHSDFSLYEYYNDDVPYDIDQVNWKLRDEDSLYKLPYLKKAKAICPEEFRLISSLWTVPKWMREKSDFGSRTQIKKKYYESFALYIIKFLLAYREAGMESWGVTYANEPIVNLGADLSNESSTMFTVWTINRLINFAIEIFIPLLRNYGLEDIKVVFFDDNRFILSNNYLSWMSENSTLSQYMEYTGLHSYSDDQVKATTLDNLHRHFPKTTILTTEYCAGQRIGPQLGSWSTAEFYAPRMIEELNHFTSGWIDWNMVLNPEGGPHFTLVSVDAQIIIDAEKNIFYKQPSYYVMGHFSKFMPRGSVKIGLQSVFSTGLEYGAVERPDGKAVVVLYNPSNDTISTAIYDKKEGEIRVTITPYSINTIIF